MEALIPAVFCGRFSPDDRIRDAMRRIWAALAPEPAAEFQGFRFPRIMDYLLGEMTAREWRHRVAACEAAGATSAIFSFLVALSTMLFARLAY